MDRNFLHLVIAAEPQAIKKIKYARLHVPGLALKRFI
jgi:hypothetical protein